MTRQWAAVALAIGITLCAADLVREAAAHSALVRANPPAGAVLQDPPTEVTLEMDAPPAPSSSIEVIGPDFQPVQNPDAFALDVTNPRLMKIGLKPIGPGTFTVQWKAVDAVDGHATTGSYAFEVRGPVHASGSGPAVVTASLASRTPAGEMAPTATPVGNTTQSGAAPGTAGSAPAGSGPLSGFLAGAGAVLLLGALAFALRRRAAPRADDADPPDGAV